MDASVIPSTEQRALWICGIKKSHSSRSGTQVGLWWKLLVYKAPAGGEEEEEEQRRGRSDFFGEWDMHQACALPGRGRPDFHREWNTSRACALHCLREYCKGWALRGNHKSYFMFCHVSCFAGNEKQNGKLKQRSRNMLNRLQKE